MAGQINTHARARRSGTAARETIGGEYSFPSSPPFFTFLFFYWEGLANAVACSGSTTAYCAASSGCQAAFGKCS